MSPAIKAVRASAAASDIEPLSIGEVAQRITVIRGQRVLLDADLARFYGETTKRLNQQVNRNQARFPEDFMFWLTDEEFANLRLQSATSSSSHGGRRYAPRAFTEHGVIMAAMVHNSERATALSVYVVRASCRTAWPGQHPQGIGRRGLQPEAQGLGARAQRRQVGRCHGRTAGHAGTASQAAHRLRHARGQGQEDRRQEQGLSYSRPGQCPPEARHWAR